MFINSFRPTDAYMHQLTELIQIMTFCLFDTEPLAEPMLSVKCSETNLGEILIEVQNFASKMCGK